MCAEGKNDHHIYSNVSGEYYTCINGVTDIQYICNAFLYGREMLVIILFSNVHVNGMAIKRLMVVISWPCRMVSRILVNAVSEVLTSSYNM